MDRKVRNRFVILLIFAGAILATIYGFGRFKAWYAQQIVTQIIENELEAKIANSKALEKRLRKGSLHISQNSKALGRWL